jgi:hypothetical protein
MDRRKNNRRPDSFMVQFLGWMFVIQNPSVAASSIRRACERSIKNETAPMRRRTMDADRVFID